MVLASPVLDISALTVTYPSGHGRERNVIDTVTLQINKGELVGLLGPNGAGKTTLIKAMIGLIGYPSGTISFFGKRFADRSVRRQIGYMPEIATYHWFLTPTEILWMFGRLAGMDTDVLRRRIDETLKTVGLFEERNILIRYFSKGMQGRINLAQALLHDPAFLVLDEPFSGLDPVGRIHVRNILKALKAQHKTVLVSSHELSEAELICDSICILRKGEVLKYGPLSALLKEKGELSLEHYFLSMIGENP
ncbi:MAG: ABC transporter ATP-binding protein [Candidatus Omnitrophica bacterium]|nr:ABC transporter ATP-binding protein [Candidatus Omnitrophota bacterium]